MSCSVSSPSTDLKIALEQMRASVAAQGARNGLAAAVQGAILAFLNVLMTLLADFRAGKLESVAPVAEGAVCGVEAWVAGTDCVGAVTPGRVGPLGDATHRFAGASGVAGAGRTTEAVQSPASAWDTRNQPSPAAAMLVPPTPEPSALKRGGECYGPGWVNAVGSSPRRVACLASRLFGPSGGKKRKGARGSRRSSPVPARDVVWVRLAFARPPCRASPG